MYSYHNLVSRRLGKESNLALITKAKAWPFTIAIELESKASATIFSIENNKYSLELSGMIISIHMVKGNVEINIGNKASNSLRTTARISSRKDLESILQFVVDGVERLSTPLHKEVVLGESKVMKESFKSKILSGNFSPDALKSNEQFIAYGDAFLDLVDSGDIYKLNYFSKLKRVQFSQLPKTRLISASKFINPGSVRKRLTGVSEPIVVATNRVKRFSSTQLFRNESWSKYDSENKVQYCMGDYALAVMPVDLGDKSFYLNSKGEKIDKILQFPMDKINSVLNDGTPLSKSYYALDSVSNLIEALSKGRFLNSYINCDESLKSSGASICLNIDGVFVILDSSAAYYAIRELVSFSEEGETFCISTHKDKLLLETDNNKKIALAAFVVSESESKDVQFMHDNKCLFAPIDVSVIRNNFNMLTYSVDSTRRIKTITKIEEYIETVKKEPDADGQLSFLFY